MRLLVPVVLVLAAAPTSAQDCAPSASDADVEAAGSYVLASPDLEVWVYEETNALPGLQRDDAARDDTCSGFVPSDMLLYGEYR